MLIFGWKEGEQSMLSGKVKWFSDKKGYGFIEAEEGGEDIFVHYSSIEMDGYRSLSTDQKVQFELIAGPKGKQAANVKRTP